MKRESELKSSFFNELARRAPHAVVQGFTTAGSPDRSITLNGRTSHWEFKHGTPEFDSPGLQLLICRRLEVQGHCRYIIWQETSDGAAPRTLIVRPHVVKDRADWHVSPEAWHVGFDHRWLVTQVLAAHNL